MRKIVAAAGIVVVTGALAAAIWGSGTTEPEPTPAGPSASSAPPGRTVPAGRHAVPAPIDQLEVRADPPRYVAHIVAGLPSGCAQRDRHDVSRQGDVITVTVLNTVPDGNPICTMIYGMYELSVDLPGDFHSGVTYTVRANDKTTTFTAR
jgi:hypothetical protein